MKPGDSEFQAALAEVKAEKSKSAREKLLVKPKTPAECDQVLALAQLVKAEDRTAELEELATAAEHDADAAREELVQLRERLPTVGGGEFEKLASKTYVLETKIKAVLEPQAKEARHVASVAAAEEVPLRREVRKAEHAVKLEQLLARDAELTARVRAFLDAASAAWRDLQQLNGEVNGIDIELRAGPTGELPMHYRFKANGSVWAGLPQNLDIFSASAKVIGALNAPPVRHTRHLNEIWSGEAAVEKREALQRAQERAVAEAEGAAIDAALQKRLAETEPS